MAAGFAVRVLLAVIAITAVSAGCLRIDDVALERARRAAQPQKELVIGAAWPWSLRTHGMYGDGIDMAVHELNAAGGVLGRTVRVIRQDDRESVNEGRIVAQRYADDPEVVAVIGHLNSHVSIPAAAIYENAGILMLTPASTSPELTRQGYRRVFRSVINDERIGRQMVDFAASRSFRRVAICYVRNEYGLGLANSFEQFATPAGIQIVDRQSYDPSVVGSSGSYNRMADEWKNLEFDAIFLAGMAPLAGHFIKSVRSAGITAAIFGGDALDTQELIDAAGPAAEGVVVASIFHPHNPRPEVQAFNRAFAERFGTLPDSWAARGYEAVKLLADAIERSGSAVPDDIAETLRSADDWSGIGGHFVFDDAGDVIGKPLVTAVVRDGRFVFLAENYAITSHRGGRRPLATR